MTIHFNLEYICVMRFLTLLFLLCFISVNAQKDIVALPGEHIEAENYGGKVELKRFLQQEMNYPENALANKIEGTVVLSFIVDSETGKPGELKVKKSVSPELDAEAIRLYKMLLFVPSYYLGDKVTTYSTLKIKFSTKAYKRYCKKRGYKTISLSLMNDSSNIIYQNDQVKIKPKMIFKDTLANFSTFIRENLKYPDGTFRLNITGIVKLYFVVEPTGRITNIKVIKDVGGGATNETIRLLKLTNWEPGIDKEGKKVRVSNHFEVNFNLSNESGMDVLPASY